MNLFSNTPINVLKKIYILQKICKYFTSFDVHKIFNFPSLVGVSR